MTVRFVFEDESALLNNDAETAKEVIALMLLASEIFQPDGVRLWLDHPQRTAGNKTPRELIALGEIRRAHAILEGLADGVFI